jgi:hypothetical protein
LSLDAFNLIFINIFYQCIATQTIPDEWKLAVATPLFKSKGAPTDMNNYRGISVLPPLVKKD